MVDTGFSVEKFCKPWWYYIQIKNRALFAVALGTALAACQSPLGGITGSVIGDGGDSGGASHLITAAETPTVAHAPSVSLTSPSTGRVYTNGNTLPLSGKCEPLFTITLSGADFQTTTCNAEGGWGLTATNTVDGEYNYALNMNDPAGIDYGSLEFTWVRDTLPPSAPTIGSPSSSPYNSNDPTLTITGACELGATVSLGGAASDSVTCDAGTYTFTISQPDGTYDFTVTQTDLAGNASPSTGLKWNKNVSLPSTPTITSPASSPYYSNASTLTISGGCTTGYTVTLGGAASQTATCASGAYGFTVTKGTDGSYSFSVTQTDPATALTSGARNQTWVRDTVAPAQLTISSPASNPFTSGDTTITISGPCEAGTTVVALSGDATASAVCTTGTYSFPVTKSADGTYNFSLVQTDPAGNASSPRAFSWTRDTSIPPTPTVLAPSTNPFYSKNSSLVISGGCVTGNLLTLSGASSQTTTCVASSYSFTVSKGTDGTYAFSITQENPNNSNVSSPASQTWIRDTVAPAAPTITSPSSNPLTSGASTITLSGGCETGATVALAGASSATQTCSSGTYSFAISKSADGTYNFTVAQTDLAGNTSSTAAFQWIRDTAVLSTPAILSPSVNPFYSNSSTVNISGTCTDGNTVNLAGAATQSATCVSSNFSFSVSKTSDGTYSFTVTQTNPNNGQTSSSAAQTWVRDTVAPAQVTITSPASNPYASGDTTLAISGGCETGAAVQMSGASTGSTTCASSTYTLSTTKSVDGTYNYSIVQMDLAGNQSTAKSFQWTRDTTTPSAPTITLPASSPYYSSSSTLSIAGDCQNGMTVSLSGADTQSTTCVGLSYAFSVTKTSDALYAFTLTQTNPNNGNDSPAASLSWVLDTSAPAAPTVTTPAANPFTSFDDTITIAGGCENGATVTLAGASTAATTCSSSSYSFASTKTSDGTYNYTVKQTDPAGNQSSSTAFQWIRDTTVPSTPTLTSPATNPITNNASSLTIAGACTTGYAVALDGADTQSATCSGGAYSFTVNMTDDGIYNFTILQTSNVNGQDSASATVTWTRDTVTPAPPVLANPASSPITASGNNLLISGFCETGATVNLSGAATASTVCAKSEFAITTSKTSNGTYSYVLTQTDKAGNASAAVNFDWIRDSTVPATPVPTSPSANPFYSSANSLTISGSCTTGNTVILSGADNLSVSCGSSAFSFTVSKSSDGTYSYTIIQSNTTAGLDSAPYSLTWVRRTAPPPDTDDVNPSDEPYASGDDLDLEGGCEKDDDIELTGDDTQTVTCADETFVITAAKACGGPYTLNIKQRHRAGIASTIKAHHWTKDCSRPSTPKIRFPGKSPILSNASTFTISGTCKTGSGVLLGGDVIAGDVITPSGSLTQTCVRKSFKYVIQKTSDGTYKLSVSQTVGAATSGKHTRKWIRDTIAPTATITSNPASTSLTVNATFTFTANESSRFECKLDGGSYATCASPTTYAGLTNASHTFSVRAIDKAGNVGTAASYTWTQQAANAIAVYHLNQNNGIGLDSGLFTGANHNDMTNSGATGTTTSKFGQAARFTASGSNYMFVTDRPSQSLGNQKLTAETWIRFAALPSNGNYHSFVTKSGASGQYSWEFKVKRLGSNIYLIFVASLDGTTKTEVKSVQLTGDTTTFHHAAVTWNKGSVKFFWDGAVKGTASVGSVGTATLFTSTSDMRLGRSQAGEYFDGYMDEARISQVIRYNSAFTPPTSIFSPD